MEDSLPGKVITIRASNMDGSAPTMDSGKNTVPDSRTWFPSRWTASSVSAVESAAAGLAGVAVSGTATRLAPALGAGWLLAELGAPGRPGTVGRLGSSGTADAAAAPAARKRSSNSSNGNRSRVSWEP